MNKKRILVTAATGFSGKALVKLLAGEPCELIQLEYGELLKSDALRRTVVEARPDEIYHLGGSYSNEYDSDYAYNVSVAQNILSSVSQESLPARVLLIGSAAEYGVPDINPISETHPLRPVSVHGLTKMYQTELAHYWHRAKGVQAIVARTFNLYGEGISGRLLAGKIQQDIQRYKAGEITKIVTGDLSATRDYIHVDDAVRHYAAIMERGIAGEVYNVGAGTPRSIRTLVASMLDEAGVPIEALEEHASGEVSRGVGAIWADISKLKQL